MAGVPTVISGNEIYPWGTTFDTYTLTFSEEVFGVDTSNVTWMPVIGTGTMDSITHVDGINYDIDFSGAVDGDQYLLIIDTDVEDFCGNHLTASVSIMIEIDVCSDPVLGPPTVTSGAGAYLSGTTSDTYTLTFSEDVLGVDTSNVSWVAITGSGTMDSITQVSANTYDIDFSSVTDGDQYILIVDTDVTDVCLNNMASPASISIAIAACADPVVGPPIVTSPLSMSFGPAPTGAYTLVFNEDVFGVDTSNVSWTPVTGTGTMNSITPENATTYDIAFSGVAAGDQYVIVVDTDVVDTCGTPLGAPVAITITFLAEYFFEDFESFAIAVVDGQGGWTGTPGIGAGYDWYAESGPTFSMETGPIGDHTTGSGVYVYTEASIPAIMGETAHIETPSIDLSTAASPVLSFWYHMYGADIDDLVVAVDGGSGYVNVVTIPGEQHYSEADPWTQIQADLSSFVGSVVTVRFTGTRGPDFRGDMAVDDILVSEPMAPTADFMAGNVTPGVGEVVDLFDLSYNGPTSWSWTITGPGSVTYQGGTTNTDQDPQVSFGALGLYTVELQATNTQGSDTETKVGYIDVQSWYFIEDFEGFTIAGVIDGQYGWTGTPGTGAGYDWLAESGYTGSFDTGPAGDHTTGTGTYAYTEASSPAVAGNTAFMETPSIDLSGTSEPQLVFWYHMYGADIDDLVVAVDAGFGYITLMTITGEQHGSETDPWKQALVDLSSFVGNTITIRFTGTRGLDFHGDMAVDDILVREATAPTAEFAASETMIDIGQIVDMTDLSYDGPTTWSWTFSGPGSVTYHSGTTSTHQNPQVSFGAAGTYTVQLLVSNTHGSDTEIKVGYIEVVNAFLVEDFESWLPTGWSIINNGGDCVWDSTTSTGRPNYAGTGNAADADSDYCGTGTTMDTDLHSPVIDLSSASSADLGFLVSFNFLTTGNYFAVDVSDNGGSSWTNELYWSIDHADYGPGESVVIDLDSYVGSSNVIISFRYYAPAWDYWAIIDDVIVY